MKTSLMQKDEYHAMYKAEETMWWYRGLRDVLEYYISQKGQKLQILDAGCGTGMNMKFLLAKGHLVQGIDISNVGLTLCKKRGLKNVKKGSVLNIPFQKHLFDAVVCLDVLGSMTSDNSIKIVIEEFHRVLKTEGVLLIHCAALPWLRSPHDTVTNLRVRFLKNQLKTYFLSSSWDIVKCSYRVFFLFPFVAVVKLMKKLFWPLFADKTDQYTPPVTLNSLFFLIQIVENRILQVVDFPIGSSLILIAKKRS